MMSMLEGLKGENCRRNAWIAGVVVGVVVLLLALLFGVGFFWALVLGLVLGMAAAFYLMSQLCTDEDRPAVTSAPPAPRTAAPTQQPASRTASATPRPAAATPRPPAPAPRPSPEAEPAPAPKPVAPVRPVATPKPVAPKPAAKPEPEPAPAPAAAADDAARPPALSAPRDGGADDLKKIKGVGPKLEKMLNGMGFYHFDQIAAWTPAEIAWVDQNLEGFKGRVSRDAWVSQAQTLAEGGSTEFSNRVDKGGVY